MLFGQWRTKQQKDQATLVERLHLIDEIKEAKKEWDYAQLLFNYAVGQDEIDHAISLLEITEKRYDMLIKRAKRLNLQVITYGA